MRSGLHFPPKDEPLRDDVRRLGALVGEVLREQGGDELFDRVEAARRAAIERRETDGGEPLFTEPLALDTADDLTRRIPYSGSPDDEVGRLIIAFNDTLARLDKLFTTQRRFIADIGHELRTPLTVMRGNLDLMHRTDKKDPESIQSIEMEVDRLTRLVEDLLLLAQAEVGKLPLDRRQIELDTVLLEVFAQVRVLAGERVEVRIGEIDQVLVCGDRDRLKQVALNLLANAVKYTPEGGAVRADLSKDGAWAVLSVQDNGPGIAAEDLPHICERF